MEYRTNSDDEVICSFIFDWLQEDLSASQKSLGRHYELLDDKRRDMKILEFSSGSKLQESILINGIDSYIFLKKMSIPKDRISRFLLCISMIEFLRIKEYLQRHI